MQPHALRAAAQVEERAYQHHLQLSTLPKASRPQVVLDTLGPDTPQTTDRSVQSYTLSWRQAMSSTCTWQRKETINSMQVARGQRAYEPSLAADQQAGPQHPVGCMPRHPHQDIGRELIDQETPLPPLNWGGQHRAVRAGPSFGTRKPVG